jgi:predicted acetyltransferase
MADTDLAIRTGTSDDFDAVSTLLSTAFHHTIDEEAREIDRRIWEPERALVATDGDMIVGHANVLTRDLTIPGNVVPAAHVSGVGVAPTHRRRGVLTRLMERQLRDVRDAGREPVAVLWASEGRIYPRFGYGLAAYAMEFTVDLREVRLPAATTQPRLRVGLPADLRPELTKVYDQVRADRPGWSSRSDPWWTYTLADTKAQRRDATELRVVLHETDGGVDGYALWRTRSGWNHSGPDAEVQIKEIVATNPEAYAALWRLLLGIDLARRAGFGLAAVDDPLLFLAAEPSRLGPRLSDSLWVRVVDVPGALAARRYVAPVDAVLEVTDALLPENAGRWRVVGGPDGARCDRTDAPADLALDIVDLGAVYLGGVPLAALAAAGRVRELRAGGLAAASLAFGWHRAPHSPEVF